MMLIIILAYHSVDLNQVSDQSLIKFCHIISVSSDSELIEQLSEKLSEYFHQWMSSVICKEERDFSDIMSEVVIDHLSQI